MAYTLVSAVLPPLPLPPCCAAALFPVFVWLCVFALFPELVVLPPDTTPLFWLEDCDWPIPWLAVLPPLPLPPCCPTALLPVLFWLCVFALFPEPVVLPPDTTPLFWLEDCD